MSLDKAIRDDRDVFEQRAHELAAKAGITLDREECPPEWNDFMDAARSDVLLQRGIAHIRTKGLPEELCDYLTRTWITHVETFERCRSEPDVTMAASWARRHAKVAAAVLAMPPLSGVSSPDAPAPRQAREPRVWDEGDFEPDPRPRVVEPSDGHQRVYLEDWGGWALRNEPGVGVEQWNELPTPITEVLSGGDLG